VASDLKITQPFDVMADFRYWQESTGFDKPGFIEVLSINHNPLILYDNYRILYVITNVLGFLATTICWGTKHQIFDPGTGNIFGICSLTYR